MGEDSIKAKAVSRTVALPRPTWETVDEIVKSNYGDNRSAFFRELVDARLSNDGSVPKLDSPDPLLALCDQFAPTLKHEMAAFIEALPETEKVRNRERPVTQQQIIAELLNALLKRVPEEIGLYGNWEIFTADEYHEAINQAQSHDGSAISGYEGEIKEAKKQAARRQSGSHRKQA